LTRANVIASSGPTGPPFARNPVCGHQNCRLAEGMAAEAPLNLGERRT